MRFVELDAGGKAVAGVEEVRACGCVGGVCVKELRRKGEERNAEVELQVERRAVPEGLQDALRPSVSPGLCSPTLYLWIA